MTGRFWGGTTLYPKVPQDQKLVNPGFLPLNLLTRESPSQWFKGKEMMGNREEYVMLLYSTNATHCF